MPGATLRGAGHQLGSTPRDLGRLMRGNAPPSARRAAEGVPSSSILNSPWRDRSPSCVLADCWEARHLNGGVDTAAGGLNALGLPWSRSRTAADIDGCDDRQNNSSNGEVFDFETEWDVNASPIRTRSRPGRWIRHFGFIATGCGSQLETLGIGIAGMLTELADRAGLHANSVIGVRSPGLGCRFRWGETTAGFVRYWAKCFGTVSDGKRRMNTAQHQELKPGATQRILQQSPNQYVTAKPLRKLHSAG